MDNVVKTLPAEDDKDDSANVSLGQSMICNGNDSQIPVVSSISGHQYDNINVKLSLTSGDNAPCNGSTGILLFQSNLAANSASNVPVLVSSFSYYVCYTKINNCILNVSYLLHLPTASSITSKQ